MSIESSEYQYFEVQDIPIQYHPEYEHPSKAFNWKKLVTISGIIAVAVPIVVILAVTFLVVKLFSRLVPSFAKGTELTKNSVEFSS